MPLDEVVGRQALADGDGRAGRQRQDEPRADEGEDGADEHVVDGEPPVGDTAAVGARQPHAAPRFMLDAGQRGDERAEGVAAHLEIAELVERGAGGRQQHDGLARVGRGGIAGRGGGRRIQRSAALEGDLAVERGGELVRRLADQVGLGDAAEVLGEAGDAARLRLAAEDPVDVAGERDERLLGRVRVRRLAVVDEQRARPGGRAPPCGGRGPGTSSGSARCRRPAAARAATAARRWRRRRSRRCAPRAASRCRR